MNQELIYPMILSVFRDIPFIGTARAWDAIEALVYMYGDESHALGSFTKDSFDVTVRVARSVEDQCSPVTGIEHTY